MSYSQKRGKRQTQKRASWDGLYRPGAHEGGLMAPFHGVRRHRALTEAGSLAPCPPRGPQVCAMEWRRLRSVLLRPEPHPGQNRCPGGHCFGASFQRRLRSRTSGQLERVSTNDAARNTSTPPSLVLTDNPKEASDEKDIPPKRACPYAPRRCSACDRTSIRGVSPLMLDPLSWWPRLWQWPRLW